MRLIQIINSQGGRRGGETVWKTVIWMECEQFGRLYRLVCHMS